MNDIPHIIDISVRLDGNVAVSDLTADGELDTLLVGRNDDAVAPLSQVGANTLELRAGHLDDRLVLSVGNAESLSVDVHKLELEVRDLVCRNKEIISGTEESDWTTGGSA